MEENALVCVNCDKKFFEMCHYCKEPLKTDHVVQDGYMWHPNCFARHFEQTRQRSKTLNTQSIQVQLESTASDAYNEDMVTDDANYNFMTITYNEINGEEGSFHFFRLALRTLIHPPFSRFESNNCQGLSASW